MIIIYKYYPAYNSLAILWLHIFVLCVHFRIDIYVYIDQNSGVRII
jgi:hypothetical protein